MKTVNADEVVESFQKMRRAFGKTNEDKPMYKVNTVEIGIMSSEEIADEIQREAIEEHIPYYAAMIECYADKIAESHTAQTLDRLENELEIILDDAETMVIQEKAKGEICEYLFNELEDVLQLIEEVSDESINKQTD